MSDDPLTCSALEQGADTVHQQVKRMHKELEQREREERLQPLQQRNRPPRRSGGISVAGFFARVGLFYLLIAYFLVCPTDTTRERAVCRGIDSVQGRLASYEPHLRPYLQTAHKKLDPYIARVHDRTDPYVAKVRPYYTHADRLVRPQVARAVSTYQQRIHPSVLKGIAHSQAVTKPYVASLKKQYQLSLAPSVEWYSHAIKEWYKLKAEPHVSLTDKTIRKHSKQVYDVVSPLYFTGVPLAQRHYHQTVLPLAKTSYSTSRRTYVKQIHPRLIVAGRHTKVFYRTKVLPALQRFYSLFIAPQLDKISERIFEYRTKKSRAEAAEHVAQVEKEVLSEQDTDNFEGELRVESREPELTFSFPQLASSNALEFISDLRNTPDEIDTSQLPPSADAPAAAEPSLSPSELAALKAEKRTALETLQTTYEKEITKLGQTEHDLLLERLVEIRQNAVADIPKRFDVLLTNLDEEGDKMVGRLGKYFTRAATDERYTPEEKVKDAEFLSKKAVAKVKKMSADVKVEAEEYKKSVREKEEKALKKASEALEALVGKAQVSCGEDGVADAGADLEFIYRRSSATDGPGSTTLPSRTGSVSSFPHVCISALVTDLSLTIGYHGLGKAEKNWKESYRGVQSGTIKDSSLASLKPVELLEAVEVQADSIVEIFSECDRESHSTVERSADLLPHAATILAKILAKGCKEIMGEWTGVVDEAQKAYAVASEKAASAASIAKESASSLAGIKPSPSNAYESATSLASVAQASAASIAKEAAAAIPVVPVVDNIASVYGEASQTVLRAVGSEPSPTDLRQSASSAAKAAALAAETAYAEASQSILRALGSEPKPTDVQQSITSLAKALESSASVALAGASSALIVDAPASVSSALGAASSAVDAAVDQGVSLGIDLAASASSLAAAVPSFIAAAPVYDQLANAAEGAAESAATFFGEASQTVVRAVGGEPSPTDVAQSATSVLAAMKSAGSSVLSDVAGSASSVKKEAASTISSVVHSASSVASPSSSSLKSKASVSSGGIVSSVESLASQASSVLHDATRTTPEGVRESATSLASVVKSAVHAHVEL